MDAVNSPLPRGEVDVRSAAGEGIAEIKFSPLTLALSPWERG
jgi:hypothetical protein